jgi:hypothetical protein
VCGEKGPSGRVGPELSFGLFVERCCVPLLVRVDCRAVVAAPRKRRQPGRAHAPLGGERRDPRDVERAPGAAGLARCEADAIALRVDRLPQPINPAKAERFID